VHPSAAWILWISSAFFNLPGFIPSAFAFIFISGILILFFATLVAAILCLSFYSVIYFYKYFVLQPTHFYSSSAKHLLIYFEHLRKKVEKNYSKNVLFYKLFLSFYKFLHTFGVIVD